MSNFILTPLMNLPNPVPGVDPGPDYADNIQSCFKILDGHNHSAGSGNQIMPSGILINADLPFNSNNATQLRSIRFTPQVSPIGGAQDLGCLYESGVDLWYNDGSGNQVQMTSGGLVNATSSGISSGTATASFSGGVLVVDSNTNTPANIKCGSVLIGNNTVSPNFVTLAPPNALASNYTLTMPAGLPGATNFVGLDSSGNISAYAAVAGGITGSNIAAGTVTTTNIASATIVSGNIATNGVGRVNLPNVGFVSQGLTNASASSSTVVVTGTLTIVTTGRPVFICVAPSSPSASGIFTLSNNTGGTAWLARNGSDLVQFGFAETANPGLTEFPGNLFFIDSPSAGSTTYQLVIAASGAGSFSTQNLQLQAYELMGN